MTAIAAAEPVQPFEHTRLASISNLPTILLTPATEVPNAISIHDSNVPALAVAEQLPLSNRDADLEFLSLRRADRYAKARAEFVSAHFYKASSSTSLGITLGTGKKTAIIDKIAPNSLVAKSPLQVGDKILSINQRPCSKMTSEEICGLLRNTLGNITVIAHNPLGGASDVVESMLTKANPKDSIGIGVRHDQTNHKFIITRIFGKSIADSLLNVGDEIISINGVATEKLNNETEVKELITGSTKIVTIKAITLRETGVVLGETSTRAASHTPQRHSAGTTTTTRTTTTRTRTNNNNTARRVGPLRCLFQAIFSFAQLASG